MKNVLVVGADSGIGNAIHKMIPNSKGTSRRVNSEFTFLNVEEPESWPSFNEKFDEIYYCIGISGQQQNPERVIKVNSVMTYQCLDHLSKFVVDGGTIRVMSSVIGSLTVCINLPLPSVNPYYRMSKAALNMGVVKLSHVHPTKNWQLIHPGFVDTKMTEGLVVPGMTPLTPEESASKIINLPYVQGVSFYNVMTTSPIPW